MSVLTEPEIVVENKSLSEKDMNILNFVFGTNFSSPFLDEEDDNKYMNIDFKDINVLTKEYKKAYFDYELRKILRTKHTNVFEKDIESQIKRIRNFPSFMLGDNLYFEREDQLVWWGMRHIQNSILFGKLADRQIIREINTDERVAKNFESDKKIKTDWANDLIKLHNETCKIQSISTMCGQCDFVLELYDLYLRVKEGKEKLSCKLLRRAQMMKDSGFEESFMVYEILNSKVNCECKDEIVRCKM